MKQLIFSLMTVMVIALIFTACKGDTGPAGTNGTNGTVGPAGPTGASGATGATGPQGPTGTANVIYSAWFTPAQNGNWVDTTINGVAMQKKFKKAASGVTLSVLNTGVVLSYVKLNPDGIGGTTTTIRQLPYAYVGQAREFIQLAYNGSITYAVTSTANPGVAITTALNSILEFRYVIIPGGVAGGRFTSGPATGYTVEQVKAMSYEQVKTMFNIPENGTNEK
jgi:hypothetical protein